VLERFGDPFVTPLEPYCSVIQFDEPLSPAQLEQASRLVADRPDVELYVYGRIWRDLSFLRHFPNLQRLHIALWELDNIAGFFHLAGGLRGLTFGETRKKFSLRFIEVLPRLERLFLVGHKTDLRCIQSLSELEDLGLSGITLPDLGLLLPFRKLRKLHLFLGSTRNLAELARLPGLEELSIMRISKLSDLGILADLGGLKRLRLNWMRNVTSLPSLHGLQLLDDVELDLMKGLTDLSPVAAAPALRRLAVGDMRHLTADSFRCFIGHPRLRELLVETGKLSLDARIIEVLPGIARPWSTPTPAA
jgi:hypothetical protein